MQTQSVNNSVTFEPTPGNFKMRFDDEITVPSYYRFELEALATANPEDKVLITTNSDGGSLATGIEVTNAIANCKAPVHGILRSSCHSCGSIIFLACDTHEVGLASEMLLHAGSGGNYGTPTQTIQRAESYTRQVRSLFETVYLGFLSPEELDAMIENDKEFIFCSSEIESRLENMYKYRQDHYNQALEDSYTQQFAEEDAMVEEALAALQIPVAEREVFDKISSQLEDYFSQEQPVVKETPVEAEERLKEVVETLTAAEDEQVIEITNGDNYFLLYYRYDEEDEVVELELQTEDEELIVISKYALEDYDRGFLYNLAKSIGAKCSHNSGKPRLIDNIVTYLEELVE